MAIWNAFSQPLLTLAELATPTRRATWELTLAFSPDGMATETHDCAHSVRVARPAMLQRLIKPQKDLIDPDATRPRC